MRQSAALPSNTMDALSTRINTTKMQFWTSSGNKMRTATWAKMQYRLKWKGRELTIVGFTKPAQVLKPTHCVCVCGVETKHLFSNTPRAPSWVRGDPVFPQLGPRGPVEDGRAPPPRLRNSRARRPRVLPLRSSEGSGSLALASRPAGAPGVHHHPVFGSVLWMAPRRLCLKAIVCVLAFI